MKKEDKINNLSLDANGEERRENIHRKIFSQVSHDLRTPLSLILGSLEIYDLMKDKLTEDRKDTLVKMALEESYRLDNFINNILEMERVENKSLEIRKSNFNLTALLDECIETMSNRLKNNEIKIINNPHEINLISDKFLLSKVIKLLLDNAIRYGGSNEPILIESELKPKQLSLKIHDNGSGIAKEYREDIFKKYYKIDKLASINATAGLGLTICLEIISLLGGTITAKNSDKYSGAMFTIEIPLN